MDPIETNKSLKIYLPLVRCGEVRFIIDALEALEAVYTALLQWRKLVAAAEQNARAEDGIHYRGAPRHELAANFQVADDEALCLARVEVTAPAYVEIVGAAGPLESLQKQEPEEDRRLALEQQRIDAVRDEVELLRGLNYPEVQIREALSKYVFAPFDHLDRFRGLTLYEEDKSRQESDIRAETRR
jgi:hypothetical protein